MRRDQLSRWAGGEVTATNQLAYLGPPLAARDEHLLEGGPLTGGPQRSSTKVKFKTMLKKLGR